MYIYIYTMSVGRDIFYISIYTPIYGQVGRPAGCQNTFTFDKCSFVCPFNASHEDAAVNCL